MKLGKLIWIGEKKTALRADLENRCALVVVRSGKQAAQAALRRLPQAIVVDQTSLRSSGARLCSNLRRALGDAVPLLIVGGAGAQEAKASKLALSNLLSTPSFSSAVFSELPAASSGGSCDVRHCACG